MADPTILDAFVVTFGLDPREYTRGEAEMRSRSKRTKEDVHAWAKQVEADQKRQAEAFKKVRTEVVGLYLAMAGASSLKDFVSNIILGGAATGRLATNLGMATGQLSAWEEAVKRVGGEAADADNALRSMVTAYQSYRLTGTTGHDADFQGLGVSLHDLQDPAQALMKMADAGERLGRPEFVARLQRIGIPEPTIVLLEKGRKGLEALLEQQSKLGVVTERDAAAAQKLQDRTQALGSAIRGAARGPLTDLIEGLNKWVGTDKDLINELPAIEGAVGGVTIGIAAMTVELWIIPAAIGAIIATVVALEEKLRRIGLHGAMQILRGDAHAISSLLHGDFAEARRSWADLDAGGTGLPGGAAGAAPGGGGAPVAPPSARRQQTYGSLRAMLLARGMDDAHASGIAAGLMAESRGDPNGINPKSGAWGLAQWLGARTKSFRRVIGRDLRGSSLADQMRFLLWELHGGDRGGAAVMGQHNSASVLDAFIRRFERPGAGHDTSGDIARGASYLGGARAAVRHGPATIQQITRTGDIVINLTGDSKADGRRLVNEMHREIKRRGLVTQANGGLQ